MALTQSAYHLADEPSLYQPVRKNNFRFYADFSSIDLLKVNSDASDPNSYITNGSEILDFSVVKFDPPHFSQEAIEIKRGNSKIYFAGVPTFDEKDLVINDFAGADGKSVLMAWQALSYNLNEDVIPTSEKYKIKATVIEYLHDGTPIRHWILDGCWITKLNEDGWDAENADKKQITATIKYDRAREFLGEA